jgi:hypothetical protein
VGDVPKPVTPLLTQAVKRLADAVGARSAARSRKAAIEVARLAFDLQLRYRPTTEIDLARSDLWAAQILVDAASDDTAGVNADVFALDYIRDRYVHSLEVPAAARLNTLLGEMQAAVIDDDLETIVDAAKKVRGAIAEILPAG